LIIQEHSIFLLEKKTSLQFFKNLKGYKNPIRLNHCVTELFSLSEKGVEFIILVTPNLTLGIREYNLFYKFCNGWIIDGSMTIE
jgi:hypothetical protein